MRLEISLAHHHNTGHVAKVICIHTTPYFFREQLSNVRGKAAEEEESHDKLLKDLKQQIRDAENDKLVAWDTCKQSVNYHSIIIYRISCDYELYSIDAFDGK